MTPPAHPDPSEPTLTFWGAATSVSGSMHLLESARTTLLFDCGLNQGRGEEAYARNAEFPFDIRELDGVVISHVHIDHCGNLPTLVRQGYSGPIYCTPPTRDLLRVMLRDSAKIQEEEAGHLNIARKYAEPLVTPLYTLADVERVLSLAVSVPYNKVTAVNDIRFRFIEAGHILGSAMIHAVIDTENGERSVTFTGDLGRRGMPMLKQSKDVPAANLLICESTYGNRRHDPIDETVQKLYAAIRTTIDRGGKVLIPAFSLGRSQLIIHFLQQGLRNGDIPRVPIYVDSPLASDIAEVYRNHLSHLEPDAKEDVYAGQGILGGDGVTYVREFEESLKLVSRPGVAIVIASSGMCDAGRIIQHLKHNIDDPRASVILVSFQAPGTTGRRLLEPKPTVRIGNKDWNKWIEVHHLQGFSGHADRDDFIEYLGPIAKDVTKVRLIHGESAQAEALAGTLAELGYQDIAVPRPGDRVTLA